MNTVFGKLFVLCSLFFIAAIPTHAGAGCDGGIGGTGNLAHEGGIGGTGHLAQEGGIGGTGNLAKVGGFGGTGIIGTITGFASICVNGLEVHFDQATRVSINGTTADPTRLAVGQVIALHAENSPKGLHALSVVVLHALEGPVTDVSPGHGLVLVMGRTVRMTTGTKLDGLIALGDLRPGSMVRVSGYRNSRGEIVATRIQLAQGLREASAIGIVAKDRRAHFSLDGLPVTNWAVAPDVGGEAMVRGSWNGKELIAREMWRDPSLPFAGRVTRVVAEGLIVGAAAGGLHISGFEVDIGDNTTMAGGSRAEFVEGRKVHITGELEHGRHIKAERVELLRHDDGIDSDHNNSRQPRQKQLLMKPDAHSAGAMEHGERDPSMGMSIGERVNRLDRMERLEKPERMERPSRMERIERPECMESPAGMKGMDRPHMGMMERPSRK